MSNIDDDDTIVVPISEEVVRVHKTLVESGKVTIRTVVENRDEVVHESLVEERVQVTRVPVDKVVDRIPTVRTEGDLTIIPVFEERLVVTKTLVLIEEVHIQRIASDQEVKIPVTLRRQIALIDQA